MAPLGHAVDSEVGGRPGDRVAKGVVTVDVDRRAAVGDDLVARLRHQVAVEGPLEVVGDELDTVGGVAPEVRPDQRGGDGLRHRPLCARLCERQGRKPLEYVTVDPSHTPLSGGAGLVLSPEPGRRAPLHASLGLRASKQLYNGPAQVGA